MIREFKAAQRAELSVNRQQLFAFSRENSQLSVHGRIIVVRLDGIRIIRSSYSHIIKGGVRNFNWFLRLEFADEREFHEEI